MKGIIAIGTATVVLWTADIEMNDGRYTEVVRQAIGSLQASAFEMLRPAAYFTWTPGPDSGKPAGAGWALRDSGLPAGS